MAQRFHKQPRVSAQLQQACASKHTPWQRTCRHPGQGASGRWGFTPVKIVCATGGPPLYASSSPGALPVAATQAPLTPAPPRPTSHASPPPSSHNPFPTTPHLVRGTRPCPLVHPSASLPPNLYQATPLPTILHSASPRPLRPHLVPGTCSPPPLPPTVPHPFQSLYQATPHSPALPSPPHTHTPPSPCTRRRESRSWWPCPGRTSAPGRGWWRGGAG